MLRKWVVNCIQENVGILKYYRCSLSINRLAFSVEHILKLIYKMTRFLKIDLLLCFYKSRRPALPYDSPTLPLDKPRNNIRKSQNEKGAIQCKFGKRRCGGARGNAACFYCCLPFLSPFV